MRASRAAQAQTDTSRAGLPFPPKSVTAENFLDKAKAFALGDFAVVRRAENAMAFWAWIAFWQRLGERTAFREKLELLTVPALWPWDFSADADYLRDEDLVPRQDCAPEPISAERRRQLSEMMRGQMPREMRRASLTPKRARDARMASRFDTAQEVPAPDAPIVASEGLLATMARRRGA